MGRVSFLVGVKANVARALGASQSLGECQFIDIVGCWEQFFSDNAASVRISLYTSKRVAIWQLASQLGMVILQPPPIPKIDHEVPWLPPEHADDLEGE